MCLNVKSRIIQRKFCGQNEIIAVVPPKYFVSFHFFIIVLEFFICYKKLPCVCMYVNLACTAGLPEVGH
jgi:hypothetical protein